LITEISEEIQEEAAEVMRNIKDLEKDAKKQLNDLEYNESLSVVGEHIGVLIDKYKDEQEVVSYLGEVKDDILENIDSLCPDEEHEEEALAILPWYTKKSSEDLFNKYKINVLVDNSNLEGAPVVIENHPTYTNLIGEIEYDSEFGNLSTDFMKIKPGSLHKANGGYLILQARDVASNANSWDTLRRILKTGQLILDLFKEYSSIRSMAFTWKPNVFSFFAKCLM